MSEDSATTQRHLSWQKSSYSGAQGGDCVEIALGATAIHVRDSKDPEGPSLTVTPAAWAAFLKLTEQQS
ncbi:DUF397 domain-containing protein [Kitasatospora viridis]|uniref:Uncharacterized protein DUF397 n=1 Tax=Kitasatospora viridis TaxID=281105 RepID=A0A561TTU9_9ACTN|nr:DUF397 domain-containing protein [Kitasatospora viridis]TWF90533.1 uncharacterized protein DUF397 [Kitasatospora viridis]